MAVTSTTLGQACTLKAGKFIAANDIADEYRDGLFPCYGGNGIRGYVTEYSHKGAYPLIGRQGALCGNVNFASGKFRATEHAVVVQPNVQMNVRWLYYKLLSMNLGQYATGAAQPGLAVAKLEQLSFSMPSLEEQDRLSTLCDDVESLISLRKQQFAKLDELVKSRFIELFGDPVQNPMGWKIVPLKSATNKIGSGATPKGGKESYQAEGIALIRSMNVHDGQFEYKDLAHITDEQAKQLENVIVEENDVFINITGASVARSCIVPQHILPARVNQHVAIIRCITSMLNPVFANQMFLSKSFKGQLLNIGESGGATRQAITKQQLESLQVILPPIELQAQFAVFVEQADKSKLTIQHSLAKLETLKKSLMQEYFG